ncbi:DNA-binding response regulator, OmpR family (Rec-wHTH domains) [Apilactobacillus kunkeei]|uniref:response regulator transcription factor n=1 Tax=Apilactobacillus kunkeei TaxID=148814 RepID=UPI0006CE7A43|nr:response regulator transcription factor [Apilactobacillus kunkeei]KPN82419.1 DNA-binding response regulator, OmpR family (Rec-wHTH domains) [Apilactobacillus kunkeei]
MVKILVVEDDKDFNNIITKFLSQNDFEVKGITDSLTALDESYEEYFDLIISDIMMPEMDGIELTSEIRKFNQNIPILFLTAKDDLATKKEGFNLGIDDYMVKPIDLDELLLRISAILRRANINDSKKIVIGDFVMDSDSRTVMYHNEDINMTVREFDILYKMLSYQNHAYSRAQLFDEFWDMDANSSLRSVDVYITKIREKIKKVTQIEIKTIHGLGYKAVVRNEK